MLIFLFGGVFTFGGVYKNKNPYTFQPFRGKVMLRSLERSLSVGEGIEDTYPHPLGGGPLVSLVPLGTFHCYLKIVYLGLIAGLVPN